LRFIHFTTPAPNEMHAICETGFGRVQNPF
jgi:hypothetical protein